MFLPKCTFYFQVAEGQGKMFWGDVRQPEV